MLLRAEEANRNLVRNLDYLKNLHDIKTDRELADKIGVSPSTIVSIRKEGKIPTVYPFFEGIMNWTEFTFEELLNSELAAQEVKADADLCEQDGEMFMYLGLYMVYYFRTSSHKGREKREDTEALEYGLLAIYRDRNTMKPMCRAIMGLEREEAEKRYAKCFEEKGKKRKTKKNFQSILTDFSQSGRYYEGNILLTHGHIFIVCTSGIKDVFSLIIHRPDSHKQRYIGGLGAALSVSKGREACPCVQFMGISRYIVTASAEEIVTHLELGYPSIVPGSELNQIVDQIQKLIEEREKQTLTDRSNMEVNLADRNYAYMISAQIMTAITRIVEQNLFRVAKVTGDDDDDWYHFCKYYNEVGEEV